MESLRRLIPRESGVEPHRYIGSLYEEYLGCEASTIEPGLGVVLTARRGSRRKRTGSYYTPAPIVEHVLDQALEPVLGEALAQGKHHPREALLRLRICDPACGTGHFLVAAARRMTSHLMRVDGELSAGEAHSLVTCGSIFGVDLNPVAAELCRAMLWLLGGRTLEDLDAVRANIRCGNALLGASPDSMRTGIPDLAFVAVEDDLPSAATYFRRRNRMERTARSEPLRLPTTDGSHARLVADTWCAAFVWRKHDVNVTGRVAGTAGAWDAITDGVFTRLAKDPEALPSAMRDHVDELARLHRFFHWHLEFPQVGPAECRTDASARLNVEGPGFDAIIGNPPFLNQLERSTATSRRVAALLQAVHQGALRSYTDLSACFLLRAAAVCRPGGRISLVQPQSILATADAAQVRATLLKMAHLKSSWCDSSRMFEGASVQTCVLTFARGDGARRSRVRRFAGPAFAGTDDAWIGADDATWAALAAEDEDLPRVTLAHSPTVADVATATADFRDQYYGLDGFLMEESESGSTDVVPVVTSGLIDLAACLWRRRATRILKRSWLAPVIDRESMRASGSLDSWIALRLCPKVLVATQTRIIECFADTEGRYVPCTPVLTVVPKVSSQIWAVAAAVASPIACIEACRRFAGTALAPGAIKLSAKQLLTLPLPVDARAWAHGAECLRSAQLSASSAERERYLCQFAQSLSGAYGLDSRTADQAVAWWMRRASGRAH
jgi:methylase of polypeptide subunit release factors